MGERRWQILYISLYKVLGQRSMQKELPTPLTFCLMVLDTVNILFIQSEGFACEITAWGSKLNHG